MIQKRKNNRDSNGDKATAQAEAGNRGRPQPPEETLSLTGGRQKQEPGRTAEDVGTRSDTANSKPWSRRPRGQPPAGPMEATPCLDRPLEGEINHTRRCQIRAQQVGKTACRAARGPSGPRSPGRSLVRTPWVFSVRPSDVTCGNKANEEPCGARVSRAPSHAPACCKTDGRRTGTGPEFTARNCEVLFRCRSGCETVRLFVCLFLLKM